jgi:hypothetical protein
VKYINDADVNYLLEASVAKITKVVMSSAEEADLGGLFINAKAAIPICKTLEELGHKQTPTPIQIESSTVCNIVKNEAQPKATKAMDMRFYWLKTKNHRNNSKFFGGLEN